MKDQRHKRKESFSVLVISNTDRSSRQFQISLFSVRLVFFIVFAFCAVMGWLIYQYSNEHKKQEDLLAQLAEQQQLAQQFEAEKESWNSERQVLASENETLRQIMEQKENTEENSEAEAEPEKDSTMPSRYPSQGSGVMVGGYTEDHRYLSINMYTGSSIVAAGDGTIVSIGSDDTYKYMIEIQHESGYTTRYLCQKEGELKVEEGIQVQSGDILVNITTDETQLDYQIFYEGEEVDPLTVIDAKG